MPSRSDRRGFLIGTAATLAAPAIAQGPLRVFAAASLKPPLDEIAAAWDGPVALSYAGSGTVARQVAAGAPADVVVLAAVDWMDWLMERAALGPRRIVARNALAFAGAAGAPPMDLTPDALTARLGEGRLAMGDPLSVPAGRYGEEALRSLGLWDAARSRLLLTENVRAALAYVARGDVPLGLVYRSDAADPGVAVVAGVPADAHAPILYPGAASARGEPFLNAVAGGRDVFAAHGFGPP